MFFLISSSSILNYLFNLLVEISVNIHLFCLTQHRKYIFTANFFPEMKAKLRLKQTKKKMWENNYPI